ncbi:hypothetical protein BOTBODRAFT_191478 [Botryobasidium botryosum FD-172 SS1]|uniref:Uncharacterized protein n=1 Tax=Botryobasidium botryosum (strain FD-172 SS1) TaxID=930990 RepID=A0A067LZJ9_BOTB1|nr:hypothetical protein BOTBODRAFT_191478 [Botryobasidium botryosum FD-172 SS1]
MASISEPFALASYSISARSTPSDSLSSVSVSHTSSTEDGYATLTVQGDGVHIMNLSTLNPVLSHTLGPSTTFSCPAVTSVSQDKKSGKEVLITYAVVEAAPEVKEDEAGRTAWIWRETSSSNLSQKKRSITLPERVQALHLPTAKPSSPILISPSGGITSAAVDLTILSTLPAPDSASVVAKSWVFAPSTCSSFTPPGSRGFAVVVILSKVERALRLRVVKVADKGEMIKCGEVTVDTDTDDIADASFDSSGQLSVMTLSGRWSVYTISTHNSTLSLVPLSTPLNVIPIGSPSLLALNTTHVFLASATPNFDLTLHIWDLQYSVLLASHSLSLPAEIASNQGVQIRLVGATDSHALLVISTPPAPASAPTPPITTGKSKKKREKADSASAAPQLGSQKSSALVVPFIVPPTSTIANALGMAQSGDKWLVSPQGQHGAKKPGVGGKGEGQATTTKTVRDYIDDLTKGVPDIPEEELIHQLKLVVASHRRRPNIGDMDVDQQTPSASSSLPSPSSFLALLITYSTTPYALRGALKLHLSDVDDLLCVLEVLETWVFKWTAKSATFSWGEAGSTDSLGYQNKGKKDALPPYDSVLDFLQTLLDASFISLLQHPPAHALLRRLLDHTTPQISALEDLEHLRGSLEPFLRAERSKAAKKADNNNNPKQDWRQRRKEERDAMPVVGPYQLEELYI